MTRVNERIRAPKVRVVYEDQQLGVMNTQEAVAKAKSVGLDLVEVAANAKPPVARVCDYGKYKYEQAKLKKKSPKTVSRIKEIKLRVGTDSHDQLIKIVRVLGSPTQADITAMLQDSQATGTPIPTVPNISPCPIKLYLPMRSPSDILELLTKMLVYNPTKRVTAIEAITTSACFRNLPNLVKNSKLPNNRSFPALFDFNSNEEVRFYLHSVTCYFELIK